MCVSVFGFSWKIEIFQGRRWQTFWKMVQKTFRGNNPPPLLRGNFQISKGGGINPPPILRNFFLNLSTLYWAFFWQNIRILFPLSWHTHSTQTEIIWFPSLSKWISVCIGYISAPNVGYTFSARVSEMSDILKKKEKKLKDGFVFMLKF